MDKEEGEGRGKAIKRNEIEKKIERGGFRGKGLGAHPNSFFSLWNPLPSPRDEFTIDYSQHMSNSRLPFLYLTALPRGLIRLVSTELQEEDKQPRKREELEELVLNKPRGAKVEQSEAAN